MPCPLRVSPPAHPRHCTCHHHHHLAARRPSWRQNIADDQTLIPLALPLIPSAMCNDVQLALSSMPHATRVGIRRTLPTRCPTSADGTHLHTYPFLSLASSSIPIRQWTHHFLGLAVHLPIRPDIHPYNNPHIHPYIHPSSPVAMPCVHCRLGLFLSSCFGSSRTGQRQPVGPWPVHVDGPKGLTDGPGCPPWHGWQRIAVLRVFLLAYGARGRCTSMVIVHKCPPCGWKETKNQGIFIWMP